MTTTTSGEYFGNAAAPRRCQAHQRATRSRAHRAINSNKNESHATTTHQTTSQDTSSSSPSSPAKNIAKALASAMAAAVLAVAPPAFPLIATQQAHALTSEESQTISLFERNRPSVVFIENLATRKDAFTMDPVQLPQGAGSGFTWDDKGHIVTNFHVVRGASDVRVTLANQEVYEAKLCGYDEDKDIAVLELKPREDGKVALDNLVPVDVGSSTGLSVGQNVYAIGNPFGLDHTLTRGVVSGVGREIQSGNTGRPIQGVIQTDAAINPGNSGGPLLNSQGELVGINTAIYSPSGASAGVSFAIPVDAAKGVIDQIIEYGRVTRPIFGIRFAPETSVEALGMKGVLVLDTTEGGPAKEAGVRPTRRDEYGRLILGDIIVELNHKRINGAGDLYRNLDGLAVGDQVDLSVLRGDEKVEMSLHLAEGNPPPPPMPEPLTIQLVLPEGFDQQPQMAPAIPLDP
eukprot:288276_1